jgi:hypothetical protein
VEDAPDEIIKGGDTGAAGKIYNPVIVLLINDVDLKVDR